MFATRLALLIGGISLLAFAMIAIGARGSGSPTWFRLASIFLSLAITIVPLPVALFLMAWFALLSAQGIRPA